MTFKIGQGLHEGEHNQREEGWGDGGEDLSIIIFFKLWAMATRAGLWPPLLWRATISMIGFFSLLSLWTHTSAWWLRARRLRLWSGFWSRLWTRFWTRFGVVWAGSWPWSWLWRWVASVTTFMRTTSGSASPPPWPGPTTTPASGITTSRWPFDEQNEKKNFSQLLTAEGFARRPCGAVANGHL